MVLTVDVERWMQQYFDAWRSNDRGDVAELFTVDAVYAGRIQLWSTGQRLPPRRLGACDDQSV